MTPRLTKHTIYMAKTVWPNELMKYHKRMYQGNDEPQKIRHK